MKVFLREKLIVDLQDQQRTIKGVYKKWRWPYLSNGSVIPLFWLCPPNAVLCIIEWSCYKYSTLLTESFCLQAGSLTLYAVININDDYNLNNDSLEGR